ncbi:MAG: FAD-binding oxidoreductase, partial [Pseudomonadota bacterium]
TGMAAALTLAEAGRSVRLLEAAEIGAGGSGRNAGLVNAGLWLPPGDVEGALGAGAGARLNAALAAGPGQVFDLIDRHAIACEARRAGTLHLAHGRGGLADLRLRAEQLTARGAPVTLLDGEETARRTGSATFPGALHDARTGTIQPLAYLRGLARAAVAAGAVLHEHSPVTARRVTAGKWVIETPGGRVRADRLLWATNAYGDGAAPALPYTMVPYFQIATAPLRGNAGATILPGGEGAWDNATVMSSFRRDAAGRLILGGIGRAEGPAGGIHRGWARRTIRRLFPQLGPVEVEHAWWGRIAMTADHIPKIARLGADGLAIWGYSGRGIAPGTVFGTAAARALMGENDALPVEAIPLPEPRRRGAEGAAIELGAALAHLTRGWL